MRARGESDNVVCAGNDLAFVELDRADWSRTNPSVPVWGGPAEGWTPTTAVYSYDSSLDGSGATRARRGVITSAQDDWTLHAAFTPPSVATGSPVMWSDGTVVGVVESAEGLPDQRIGLLPNEVGYATSSASPGPPWELRPVQPNLVVAVPVVHLAAGHRVRDAERGQFCPVTRLVTGPDLACRHAE
jgi:hypothetical protein